MKMLIEMSFVLLSYLKSSDWKFFTSIYKTFQLFQIFKSFNLRKVQIIRYFDEKLFNSKTRFFDEYFLNFEKRQIDTFPRKLQIFKAIFSLSQISLFTLNSKFYNIYFKQQQIHVTFSATQKIQ